MVLRERTVAPVPTRLRGGWLYLNGQRFSVRDFNRIACFQSVKELHHIRRLDRDKMYRTIVRRKRHGVSVSLDGHYLDRLRDGCADPSARSFTIAGTIIEGRGCGLHGFCAALCQLHGKSLVVAHDDFVTNMNLIEI